MSRFQCMDDTNKMSGRGENFCIRVRYESAKPNSRSTIGALISRTGFGGVYSGGKVYGAIDIGFRVLRNKLTVDLILAGFPTYEDLCCTT